MIYWILVLPRLLIASNLYHMAFVHGEEAHAHVLGEKCCRNLTQYPTDVLESQFPYGPHERFQDCQRKFSGHVAQEIQDSHEPFGEITLPIVKYMPFKADFEVDSGEPESNAGHIAFVNNPVRTLSVLEPSQEGGCALGEKDYVEDMAKRNGCLLTINAGFFDSATSRCLGNVVTRGKLVANSHGIQNPHFGIREDGTLFFGFLTEEDVLQEDNPFTNLVGGVGWILRDGEVYVEESLQAECPDTQETGTLDLFFNCKSGRMVIGSDREGRVVIAHVDGKTFIEGLSLRQFAVWLLKQGVVNAINLDGGGSSIFAVNGTGINYSADVCKGSNNTDFRCWRKVSTVICVHEPRCDPADCSGHGRCIHGECVYHCDGSLAESGCSDILQNISNEEAFTRAGPYLVPRKFEYTDLWEFIIHLKEENISCIQAVYLGILSISVTLNMILCCWYLFSRRK